MKLVFTGSGWPDMVGAIRDRLDPDATITAWDRDEPLAVALAEADVLVPSNLRVTSEVLTLAPRLRLIQQAAAGYDGIDLDAAAARGLPVCNAPGTNAQAVAEAALLLMLMLARRVPEAARSFAAARIGTPLGVELRGRTLGLVGRGRTGDRLAQLADALGMRIVAVRSTSSRVDLLDLLAQSDVVSLHCPLDARTRGLLDDEAFASMRPGAWLINVARGPIVDHEALVRALDSGQLGAVGLDVYPHEPWDPADPLWQRPNVVTLPHVAGSTVEAFAAIAEVVAGNVRRLGAGDPLLHRVR